jgi:hypothetical protein
MTSAREPDVEVVASAAADELRFDTQPGVRVAFPGTGNRDSRQVTQRHNIDTPVQPGKTYRRVFVATRITSRLLDRSPSSPGTSVSRSDRE